MGLNGSQRENIDGDWCIIDALGEAALIRDGLVRHVHGTQRLNDVCWGYHVMI